MSKTVRLNQYRNFSSGEENSSLLVNASNNTRTLREDNFNEAINEYNIYLDEREACTKIRLTSQINVIASNKLFNSITEIVKDEGSDNAICLNFTPQIISSSIGKKKDAFKWGSSLHDCILDTQISSSLFSDKNYEYHCGIDIFDNPILRSKNLINPYMQEMSNIDNYFNTYYSKITDEFGEKEHGSEGGKFYINNPDNTYTYRECLNKKLVSKNGWFGFQNQSKMFISDSDSNPWGYNSVINNKPTNSFIEMYPGSDLYSIIPKYNKFRNRQEKNWEYCLTYPYTSIADARVNCVIDNITNGLIIATIDENFTDSDDIGKTIIYCQTRHGLNADDHINIYKREINGNNNELAEKNVLVDSVIDEYSFVVYLSESLCENWISVFDGDALSENGITGYNYKTNAYWHGGNCFHAFNDYLNADFDDSDHIGAQCMSFKKVVNEQECNYYVRVFSRFPNLSFCDTEINEQTLYSGETGSRIIDEYSTIDNQHKSVLNKLGYSKNIFGDNMANIVFSDDIDISYIKDNLGRPLTSLYLSFFKTNYGRKEWYEEENVSSEEVEFSHCFGKLNCGFKLSPYALYRPSNFEKKRNINTMNNIEIGYGGLREADFRKHIAGDEEDEIIYKEQNYFWGDLCEYSEYECRERILQPALHRFNTQQRELNDSTYGSVVYTCLKKIQYSSSLYIYLNNFDVNPTEKKEGYYYQSSYEIPIRSFSETLTEFKPNHIKITEFLYNEQTQTYTATTAIDNFINLDANVFLFNKDTHITYKCGIENVLDYNKLSFKIYDSENNLVKLEEYNSIVANIDSYTIYKRNILIPSYAVPGSDGSGSYKWREIIQNGMTFNESPIEEYPFVNGYLYVNIPINLYVRRQDPFEYYGMSETYGISSLGGVGSSFEGTTPSIEETSSDDSSSSESDSSC